MVVIPRILADSFVDSSLEIFIVYRPVDAFHKELLEIEEKQ